MPTYFQGKIVPSLTHNKAHFISKKFLNGRCDRNGFYRSRSGITFHLQGNILSTLKYLIRIRPTGLTAKEANEFCKGKHDLSAWVDEVQPKSFLTVLTKSDQAENSLHLDDNSQIALSCHTRKGLDNLKDRLAMLVDERLEHLENRDAFLSSERHKKSVREAIERIDSFYQGQKAGAFDEVLAFELQSAAKSLQHIIGRIDTEEILDIVFGAFCVGK